VVIPAFMTQVDGYDVLFVFSFISVYSYTNCELILEILNCVKPSLDYVIFVVYVTNLMGHISALSNVT
jgi:hypothetical protein